MRCYDITTQRHSPCGIWQAVTVVFIQRPKLVHFVEQKWIKQQEVVEWTMDQQMKKEQIAGKTVGGEDGS